MSCFALPMLRRHGCRSILGAAALLLSVAACGGSGGDERSVTVVSTGPNIVSFWNDIANKTVNATDAVATTSEEQRLSYKVDLATVHVAIYHAVSAIDGRFMPFAVTPTAPAAGASIDAAASAAAYGVLRGLFPNRGAQYEAAYEGALAAIPAGDAKSKGLALGSEVAGAVVALRANDGRNVVLAPYVSGSAPGRFRSPSPKPFNRYVPFIKPFALTRADQFRPAGPPPLASTAYAVDLNQAKAVGGTVSTGRTAAQLETARFHTEVPGLFVTRNLGRFATSTTDVAEAARLMALIYVVHADTITACFEAKYFYEAWRPLSAIPLADTDDNPATASDPSWKPMLLTPAHPEYPAAHSCTPGGLGEALLRDYGTHKVNYSFDSTVTGTSRSYAGTDALGEESDIARVYGGMHFRFSTVDGVALGKQVGQWVAQRYFGRRPLPTLVPEPTSRSISNTLQSHLLLLASLGAAPLDATLAEPTFTATVSGWTALENRPLVAADRITVPAVQQSGANGAEASGRGGWLLSCSTLDTNNFGHTSACAGGYASAAPGLSNHYSPSGYNVPAGISANASFADTVTIGGRDGLLFGGAVQIPINFLAERISNYLLGYPPYSARALSACASFTVPGLDLQAFSTETGFFPWTVT